MEPRPPFRGIQAYHDGACTHSIYSVVVMNEDRTQYSYLLSVPLIIVYSVGFTTIKYTYGFTAVPLFGSKTSSRIPLRPSCHPPRQSYPRPTNYGARPRRVPSSRSTSATPSHGVSKCTSSRFGVLRLTPHRRRVTHLEGSSFDDCRRLIDNRSVSQNCAFGSFSSTRAPRARIGSGVRILRYGPSDLALPSS